MAIWMNIHTHLNCKMDAGDAAAVTLAIPQKHKGVSKGVRTKPDQAELRQ